jgi:heterodisulfide reductase subunit A
MAGTNEKKFKGNVLVVGGGVAGMNAALDLVAQGYHVDLVEKEAELGGTVTKLHRLYPLCSCCKVANRATACAQHPDITVWTGSTVSAVSGSVGDFKVTVSGPDGEKTLDAGAVVLALGVEPFDPSVYDTYAYAQFENVITSVELEWLQKPVGPFQGVPKRPSDGQVPKKVAWLQCVGSREINKCDAPYCSSVCCMYALKEAVHLKDALPEAETTIFYMDMRTHGKGYERYFNEAKEKGVRLVRSRIHSIEKAAGTEDLALEYVDENGKKQEEVFDLVVLSVGLRPSPELAELAGKLGVQLSEDHFAATENFKPAETNVPGVFVCGGTTGPRDVHQSVVEAAAAAGKAAAVLKGASGNGATPEFRDVSGEEPAIGVVISLCPSKSPEFAGLVEPLASFVKELPGVAFVERLDLTDGGAFVRLGDLLSEKKANRLIYASCTPIMHQELVEWAMKQAGLNPSLYDFVDLRALGSTPAELDRLKDLFRTAVLRARLLEPMTYTKVPVQKAALVVGGGLAGMETALALAEMDIPVTLVEKKDTLGGHAVKVRSTWKGESVQEFLKAQVEKVQNHPKITVLTSAQVAGARGFAGNFVSTVVQNGEKKEIEHGVVVLATGAHSIKPAEYGYGTHPGIYRWSDFTKKMIDDPAAFKDAKSAVFIQCVGSREPERPYCSRLCCTFAVRSAMDLKALNPDMDVYVLYRELRTFGERERIYKEAREKGVFFIRYDLDSKPQVTVEGDQLKVSVVDPILGRELVLTPDVISLQTAIVPAEAADLAAFYKVSLNEDGFYKESPAKMRPVDGETEGVFFAGLALAPKPVEESLAEAWAVAARAKRILDQDVMLVGGAVAEVDPDKCAVCLTCVRTCPFGIPFIDSPQGHAFIDPALCQGCGMCVSECPGKAISYRRLSDDQIALMAQSLLQGSSAN